MESTWEGQRLEECAGMTPLCDAMEEVKEVFSRDCGRVTPLCDASEEGKQASAAVEEDTQEAHMKSILEGEGATREQCVCMIPSCDAMEGGTRNWADLAPDLLACILVYLPLDQLILEIPLVCKAWKLASEYPLCWEKLDFSDPILAVFGAPRLIERALQHCQGRFLEINAPCLYDSHCLDLLACSAPLLQKLYISESSANDEWTTYAAPLLPNLKELDLSLCKVSYVALNAFGENCRGITKLIWHKRIYAKLPVDDGEALAIAQHYPLLKHLELNANALSVEGLSAIVDNCPALTYLDLDECRNVTRRGSDKLLNLCRARFEFFGEPYDEYSLEEEEDDDDDGDDDDDDGYTDYDFMYGEDDYSFADSDIDYYTR